MLSKNAIVSFKGSPMPACRSNLAILVVSFMQWLLPLGRSNSACSPRAFFVLTSSGPSGLRRFRGTLQFRHTRFDVFDLDGLSAVCQHEVGSPKLRGRRCVLI